MPNRCTSSCTIAVGVLLRCPYACLYMPTSTPSSMRMCIGVKGATLNELAMPGRTTVSAILTFWWPLPQLLRTD